MFCTPNLSCDLIDLFWSAWSFMCIFEGTCVHAVVPSSGSVITRPLSLREDADVNLCKASVPAEIPASRAPCLVYAARKHMEPLKRQTHVWNPLQLRMVPWRASFILRSRQPCTVTCGDGVLFQEITRHVLSRQSCEVAQLVPTIWGEK